MHDSLELARQPADWPSYWNELHDFIAIPTNGLLLDAELDFSEDGSPIRRPGSVFYLVSGKYRRHFITLWELYDHPETFNRCISMLSARAITLIREHKFDTIVTCTHTAREFVHHIQPSIEQVMGQQLLISEFGHYPWTSSADLRLHDFQTRSVLVFTDVMASGSLVRDMSARVIHSGGEIVAILCVVLSDAALCEGIVPGSVLSFDLKHGVPSHLPEVPLYALTSYGVRELQEGAFDGDKIRRIDFASVSPEILPPQGHTLSPLLDPITMFAHFRTNNALAFGFYYSNKRWSTLAVRVQRLLAEAGDAIWSKIESLIPNDAILVSTFKKDDLGFRDFVHDRLRSQGVLLDTLVLKREHGDSPRLHHALVGKAPSLRARHIVLLRASANTSEELRTLAALLAGEHVASIRVLCLVNRMGPFTLSFVNRIEQLVTGALAGQTKASAIFGFVPVYNLLDLRSEDVTRMHDRVQTVWQQFKSTTRVEHFKHIAETLARAFGPSSLNTFAFNAAADETTIRGLDSAFPREGNADLAQKMAAVVDEILHSRTRKRIVDLIRDTWRADVFLHLAGLAIADIDYLRLSGQLRKILAALRSRLLELRRERLSREEDAGELIRDTTADKDLRAAISYCIHIETSVLTAWAILAHFDKPDHNEVPLLREVLFANETPAFWHRHPINLGYHFRDIHNYGLLAFLLHGSSPDLWYDQGAKARRQQIAEDLRTYSDDLVQLFQTSTNNEGTDDQEIVLARRIRELVDLLLVEFRIHARGLWHERIRYLQGYVLRDRSQHSPLFTPFIRAETDLREFLPRLQRPIDRRSQPSENGAASNPLESTLLTGRLSNRIQEALMATLTLREVTEVATQLSHYPSDKVAKLLRPRFGNRDEPQSFFQTVTGLTNWLVSRQKILPTTDTEVDDFARLVQKVQEGLFERGCALRQSLLYFIVPLKAILVETLREANGLLKADFGEVWNRQIEMLSRPEENSSTSDLVVPMDPLFLREILRNILSNVQYNLADPSNRPPSDRVNIRFDIREEPMPSASGKVRPYVLLFVEAEGNAITPSKKSKLGFSTFADHAVRIREFGGSLVLGNLPGGIGSSVELKLISRQEYLATMQSKNHRS